MQRTMMVRFMSILHVRLSGLSIIAGIRMTIARATPIAILGQCSLSAAASSSSCDNTESLCVLDDSDGVGIGEPDGALAAFAATRLAVFFAITLPPPRFLPMDSKKS